MPSSVGLRSREKIRGITGKQSLIGNCFRCRCQKLGLHLLFHNLSQFAYVLDRWHSCFITSLETEFYNRWTSTLFFFFVLDSMIWTTANGKILLATGTKAELFRIAVPSSLFQWGLLICLRGLRPKYQWLCCYSSNKNNFHRWPLYGEISVLNKELLSLLHQKIPGFWIFSVNIFKGYLVLKKCCCAI